VRSVETFIIVYGIEVDCVVDSNQGLQVTISRFVLNIMNCILNFELAWLNCPDYGCMIIFIFSLSYVKVSIILLRGYKVLIRATVEHISYLFIFVTCKSLLLLAKKLIEFSIVCHDCAIEVIR